MFVLAMLGSIVLGSPATGRNQPSGIDPFIEPVGAWRVPLHAMRAFFAPGPDNLDFWVGSWECSGKSLQANGKDWSETHATNRIEKILGEKVVHENFAMGQFLGQSWSVFNPRTKQWHQTWVDNQGAYIDLVGGIEKDGVILKTLPNSLKPKHFSRMVFSDIKSDSFTWRWEASTDGGKSWALQWRLDYKRKAT